MSFRPTISTYVDGQLVDIGYYRNWDGQGLFFEALALAALYHDCTTPEEYRAKRTATLVAAGVAVPEEEQGQAEILRQIEEASEFPVIVDLTAKNIYVHYGCMPADELENAKTLDVPRVFEHADDLLSILDEYRIPLGHLDMLGLLRDFRESEALRAHCSEGTCALLQA